MGRVVVVGSSNTDLVSRTERLPRPGETVVGRSFATYPGGKGANQAVAARRAGADVAFVSAFGDDQFGGERRAELTDAGIDLTYALTIDGATSGVAQIVVDDDGENQIVVVPGANYMVSADSAVAAAAAGCDVLSGVLEVSLEALRAAFGSPRDAIAVLNAAPYDPRVRDLLPNVDVLVVNETEAAALLGRDFAASDVDAALDAAFDLLALGPRAAIITLGPSGAVLADANGLRAFPAPIVTVVDTTGAGDCFCGVLAAWLADGASMDAAVEAGVVAGSLAVTVAGAQPSLPWREAIVAAVARHES